MNSRDKPFSPLPSRDVGGPGDEVSGHILRWDCRYTHGARAVPRAVSLNAIVAEVEQALRPRFPSEVRWQTLPDLAARPVRGDSEQLSWLVTRLVVAARDAMPKGGDLWVATSRLTGRQVAHLLQVEQPGIPWWVGLTVSDTGQVEPSEIRFGDQRHVGSANVEGEGHDFSLVGQVIRDHGGLYRVTGKPGSGTTVMVCFPEDQAAKCATRARASNNEVTMSGGKETLLLVEDHDAVRALATAVLTRQGYQVLAVSSGHEARELLREHSGSIDLLVADVFLNGDSGMELAQELRAARPGLKVLIISGSVDEEDRESASGLPFEFLGKPFSPPQLMAKVRGVLDACPSRAGEKGQSPGP